MPLEHEESEPQKTEYVSPVPLPDLSGKTEAEARFMAAYESKKHKDCIALLSQLPPNIAANALNALVNTALRPPRWREALFTQSVELRRQCARYLTASPTPYRLAQLKPLLFDNDPDVQDAVFEMFQRGGGKSAEILLNGLPGLLHAVAPSTKAHKRGMVRVIELLKTAKTAEATPVLGDILLGNLPTYPFNGSLEKCLKYAAMTVGVLVMSAIVWAIFSNVFFNYEPYAYVPSLMDVMFWMFGSLIASTVAAGAFYIGSFTFCLPYLIVRDNRLQALFRNEAMQAIQHIGDKRALKALLQADYRVGGKSQTRAVILELLPLLEEGDRKWLGRVARDWLSDNLRETSTDETLILLRATDLLGSEAQIASVLRLSKRAKSSEVRAEAARVLAILESRRDAKQEKRGLLRASDAPDDFKETLLRPLQDRRDPEEEKELLHPSEKPDA